VGIPASPRRARALLVATVVFVAAASFALGLVVAGREATPAPLASASSSQGPSLFPSASSGPRILFDPASIVLLPDASLRLELPSLPDAGAAPTEPGSR
jgi:hypothetical protein